MHVKIEFLSSVVFGTTRKIVKFLNFILQIKVKKLTTWLNFDGPGPNVTRLHANVCQNRYFQVQRLRRNFKKMKFDAFDFEIEEQENWPFGWQSIALRSCATYKNTGKAAFLCSAVNCKGDSNKFRLKLKVNIIEDTANLCGQQHVYECQNERFQAQPFVRKSFLGVATVGHIEVRTHTLMTDSVPLECWSKRLKYLARLFFKSKVHL